VDFFRAQAAARRSSSLLIVYFALAVLLIASGVYFAVTVALFAGEPRIPLWHPQLFLGSTGATLLLILGGSLYKIAELAQGGGAAVAEALGARRVERATDDLAERRLLNVVEEMAIASGVAVPPVYVLGDEHGINAFAAGTSPNEAVVAVTRGALTQLNRDELQGVIAHEFSHILNGDMRLNLRLVGVLHGILLLALIGRGLLEGGRRSSNRKGGGAVLFGLALLLIGYMGVFFGRLIKAAVSRQREYLADASAVQFTRNPAGIAGALKKIGGVGSRVLHPRAEEASHFFFGEGIEHWWGWFATHPPLAERIRRLDPAFDGAQLAPVFAAPTGELQLEPQAFAAAVGKVREPHLEWAHQLLNGLPEALRGALHDGAGARAVVYALLLPADSGAAHAQLTIVAAREGAALREVVEDLVPTVRGAGPEARLPLIDLALPTLQQLPAAERERFLDVVRRMARADRRLDLFEYALQQILERHLRPEARRARAARHDVRAIRDDCRLLLSALAWAGNRGDAVPRAFAAAAARAPLGEQLELALRGEVTLSRLDAALQRLVQVAPRFQRRLVEACAAAVASDGRVTVAEGELLRAICAVLDVPVPPLLYPAAAGATPSSSTASAARMPAAGTAV